MSSQTTLTLVAGARPNFMKIASIAHAVRDSSQNVTCRIVHTGQHYDDKLSDVFFRELEIPPPDHNLNIGSSTHAEQTAKIMMGFDEYLQSNPCDCVVVVGDVNSTLACTLVAAKRSVAVAHVEAGLESGDLAMPEEVNRRATDSLANFLFCTSQQAVENLKRRGRQASDIFLVGNTMIDTLSRNLKKIKRPSCLDRLPNKGERFALCTLHRPSNVDDETTLEKILAAISQNAKIPVVFPVHPRTRRTLPNWLDKGSTIFLEDPLGYTEFLYLTKHSEFVLTDSGGIQEETTFLQIPCLTLRKNTERPETVDLGTNEIVGIEPEAISSAIHKVQNGKWKQGQVPPLWDGRAGERIVGQLVSLLS